MLKNMTGMNDPAFQSNKTLKEYINQKLNSYMDPKLCLIQKAKSFTKFNDKSNSNLKYSNQKLSYNISLKGNQKYNKNNINDSSKKENLSSKSLNKKINNKNSKKKDFKKIKNGSFLLLKYNNSTHNYSLNIEKNKPTENSICLNVNDNSNIIKYNLINNTPISMKQKANRTTPINELNKKKCIYEEKYMSLNKSFGLVNINRKSFARKNSNDNYIINQKYNKNRNPKTPLYKNSANQIKLLKEEIYNIINKNEFNNNILQLNKSYFREESKISQNNHSKILNRKINFSIHNKLDKDDTNKTKKNCVKINDLLNNDESFNPSQCPIPMPYVKRYSENLSREIKNNENINLENLLFNKDLNEPKEEKKIPLPISQPTNSYYFIGNNKKNKRNLVYSNENKINRQKLYN